MRQRAADAVVGVTATLSILVGHALGLVGSAFADAPRQAQIVEGNSMAGVTLDSYAALTPAKHRVTAGPLADWGVIRGGTCLEGSNCSWDVAALGTVEVILHAPSSRVQRIATNAPGWRTPAGIGRGSTTTSLRRAYGARLVRRVTCGLNGFGGLDSGFVLNSHRQGERRFTFFALAASKKRVSRVWIGRGRVTSGSRC